MLEPLEEAPLSTSIAAAVEEAAAAVALDDAAAADCELLSLCCPPAAAAALVLLLVDAEDDRLSAELDTEEGALVLEEVLDGADDVDEDDSEAAEPGAGVLPPDTPALLLCDSDMAIQSRGKRRPPPVDQL